MSDSQLVLPKKTDYICLDTCSIVDCAFSRGDKANPTLLEAIIARCERDGVKLLVPEVVLLELDKAVRSQMNDVHEAIGKIDKCVQEILKSKSVGASLCKSIGEGVDAAKRNLEKEVEGVIACIKNAAENKDVSVSLSLVAEDLVEATRMAIACERPAKSKSGYGLVQGDCLIVAALQRFMREHVEASLCVCSSNTADFATSQGNGKNLHPDIAKRLPGAMYYGSPAELLDAVLPARNDAEQAETERLSEEYGRAVTSPVDALAGLEAVSDNLLVALAKMEMPNIDFSEHAATFSNAIDSLSMTYLASDAMANTVQALQKSLELSHLSHDLSISAAASALQAFADINRLKEADGVVGKGKKDGVWKDGVCPAGEGDE